MFLLVGVLAISGTLRYVEASPGVSDESLLRQVSFVSNHVLSRTSNIIQPRLIRPGLVEIDLDALGIDPELYDTLLTKDSFYGKTTKHTEAKHTEAKLNGEWVKCVDNKDGTVTIGATRWRGLETRTTQPQPQPQPHTLDIGVPFGTMRLDEWIVFSFSTVDGGLYYQLRGVEPTLGDTIAKFAGADAARKILRQSEALRQANLLKQKGDGRSIYEIAASNLDDELSKSKALITHSNVTGRQRLVVIVTGTGMPPTRGVQLVTVTYDIGQGTTSPNNDPFRNVLNYHTYDGGEAILHLPNGMLLYLVFDSNDKIIASVPDSVATDRAALKVRANVSTSRVFSGLSCANCHDQIPRNWGWQPLQNDLVLNGPAVIVSKDAQALASAYQATKADLDYMLDTLARLPYQRSVTQATQAKSSDLVVKELANSYWGYWYDPVTPSVAIRDFNLSLKEEEAKAFLLRHLLPKGEHLLEEDVIINKLKLGLPITSAQWRALYLKVFESLLNDPTDITHIPRLHADRRTNIRPVLLSK